MSGYVATDRAMGVRTAIPNHETQVENKLRLQWVKPKIIIEKIDNIEEKLYICSDEKYRTGKNGDHRVFSYLETGIIEDERIDIDSLQKTTVVKFGPNLKFASKFFEGIQIGTEFSTENSPLISILLESQKENKRKRKQEIFPYMLENRYKSSPLDIDRECRRYGISHFCLTEEGECVVKYIGNTDMSKLIYIVTDDGCYPILDPVSIRKIVKRLKDAFYRG